MTTNEFPVAPAVLAPFRWAASTSSADVAATRSGLAGVQPPPAWRQVRSWSGPVEQWPDAGNLNPMYWLVGLHGGAGVTTLTAAWPAAGDARRLLPLGQPAQPPYVMSQSPYVVAVARTHHEGLMHAQDFARQAVCGLIPPGVRVLGLVLVDDADRRPAKEMRQFARVVASAYPRSWRVPWLHEWRNQRPTPPDLPRAIQRIADDLDQLTGHAPANGKEG